MSTSKVQIKCTSCDLTWTCTVNGVLDKMYNARDVPRLQATSLQKQTEIRYRVFEDQESVAISENLRSVANKFFVEHGSARDCYVEPIEE